MGPLVGVAVMPSFSYRLGKTNNDIQTCGLHRSAMIPPRILPSVRQKTLSHMQAPMGPKTKGSHLRVTLLQRGSP